MAVAANYTFESNNNENNDTYGPKIFEEYCYQHLCNILIKNSLNIPLSKCLPIKLKTNLNQIDDSLHVNTKFDTLLCEINKGFSFC